MSGWTGLEKAYWLQNEHREDTNNHLLKTPALEVVFETAGTSWMVMVMVMVMMMMMMMMMMMVRMTMTMMTIMMGRVGIDDKESADSHSPF